MFTRPGTEIGSPRLPIPLDRLDGASDSQGNHILLIKYPFIPIGMTVWADPYRRRWIGWILLTSIFIIGSFHRVSTTVIADELMRAFTTTGAQLGLLHASFFYIYAALQLPAGALIDRAGVSKIAIAGALVMSLGAVIFAVSGTFTIGFLGRAFIGLGSSVIYLTVLRYCANWYRSDEIATMNGLTIAGSGFGALLAATPFAFVVGHLGWRDSIASIGVIGILIAGLIYVIVNDTPRSAGFEPIEGVTASAGVSLVTLRKNAEAVLRDTGTWLLGLILFFGLGVSFTVLGLWAVPYFVHSYGVTVQQASNYLFIAQIGFLLGPPAFGWLSDRIHQRTYLIILATVIFTVSYAVLAATGVPPLVVAGGLLFLVQLMNGGFALTYIVAKERHPAEASATAMGAINSVGWLGAAVYPAILGAVLDVFWAGETVAGARVYTLVGYRAAFAIATVSGLLILGCAIAIHRNDRLRPNNPSNQ